MAGAVRSSPLALLATIVAAGAGLGRSAGFQASAVLQLQGRGTARGAAAGVNRTRIRHQLAQDSSALDALLQRHAHDHARRGPEEETEKVRTLIKNQLANAQAKLAEDTTEAQFCKKSQEDIKGRLEEQMPVVEKALAALGESRKEDKEVTEEDAKDAHDATVDAEMALDSSRRALRKPVPTEGFGPPMGPSANQAAMALVGATRAVRSQEQAAATDPVDVMIALDASATTSIAPAKASLPSAPPQRNSSAKTLPRNLVAAAHKHRKVAGRHVKHRRRLAEMSVREAKYELKAEVATLENMLKERELIHQRCVVDAGNEQSYEQRVQARADDIDSLKDAFGILHEWKPHSR